VTVPIKVLFVCTGNSARSQMAEALLGLIGGAEFEAHSAGTEPHGLNPYTYRVLEEVCCDWSGARSKAVTEFLGQRFDYVVTVCDRARQTCPVFPGRHESLHWDLEDPAEVEGSDADKLAAFRRTRTQMGDLIRPFVEQARRARGELPTVEPTAG
jgi:arsenate reductase